MNAGLIIANTGSDISHDRIYDSRLKKLTVDPEPREKHFDVIELSGGTKWTISNSDTTIHEETLLRIKHNFPFEPQYVAYFLPIVNPYGGLFLTSYSINQALMVFNAVGVGAEWLEASADTQYFYIKHKAQRDGLGSGNYTFYGSDFTFRIRYFIFNQPGYLLTGGIAVSGQ